MWVGLGEANSTNCGFELTQTIGIIGGMEFGGYDFEQIGSIQPSCREDGSVQIVSPQLRYRNAQSLPLNKYGSGPFCKFRISNKLGVPGVYIITGDNKAMYVGECANLSKRFNMGYGNISPRNCFKRGQETNCRLNNLIYLAVVAGQTISLWFLQTNDYKSVEASLRMKLQLAWNRN